jgi:ABC-type polysaccharide/polyol phosphate transport system ATPase subunit
MIASKKEEPIIEVKHLSKQYSIGMDTTYKTLSESLTSAVRHPLKTLKDCRRQNDTFWALKDVNFEVECGEVVGIIGRNGAGKSTLLKILSRITFPTEGEVIMRGRVGSLLEVGTGFHPELSGRENIYFNGSILGMKKREIDEKFDEIVKFSGIEKFLDTPVKRYSSGMQVRLAFSVAANLDPEILVVDEVLAVGDAAFQKKCLGKMSEVAESGRTVLFVSHNMAAIENMCDRAVLLDSGRIVSNGKTSSVIEYYLSQISSNNYLYPIRSGPASLSLSIYSEQNEGNSIKIGDKLFFEVILNVDHPLDNAGFGLGVVNYLGERIVTFHTHYQYKENWSLNKKCRCIIEWPDVFLCEGNYTLVAALYNGNQLITHWDDIGILSVIAADYFETGKLPDPQHQGKVLTRAHWEICET